MNSFTHYNYNNTAYTTAFHCNFKVYNRNNHLGMLLSYHYTRKIDGDLDVSVPFFCGM